MNLAYLAKSSGNIVSGCALVEMHRHRILPRLHLSHTHSRETAKQIPQTKFSHYYVQRCLDQYQRDKNLVTQLIFIMIFEEERLLFPCNLLNYVLIIVTIASPKQ